MATLLKLPEIEDIERAKAAADQHEDHQTRQTVYCAYSSRCLHGVTCNNCLFDMADNAPEFLKWEKTL